MHVRGYALSHPRVVDALRPFIVAFWGQANDEPIPAEVLPLYRASAAGGSNVRCFVLDPAGKLLHSFNGFPGRLPHPQGTPPEAYASYFAGEILRAAAALPAPPAPRPLAAPKLPGAAGELRLLLRTDRPDSYGYPVVEAVPAGEEWKLLARPDSPRALDAGRLARWMRLCYPPGVNEQLEPYGVVRGTLTLRPAGEERAVLTGRVRMGMEGGQYYLFEGTLEAVVEYGPARRLRGVVAGTYWRFDAPRDRWAEWKLTAALESVQ